MFKGANTGVQRRNTHTVEAKRGTQARGPIEGTPLPPHAVPADQHTATRTGHTSPPPPQGDATLPLADATWRTDSCVN